MNQVSGKFAQYNDLNGTCFTQFPIKRENLTGGTVNLY